MAVSGSPSGIVEDERVTLVIAGRNRQSELLGTLERHRAPVIYVDNASTDGTAAAVRRRFPQVQVIPLKRNAGAYARTVGARRAQTPFIAFADDDSWWAAGSLATAAQTMADHACLGLLNARVLVGAGEHLDPICAAMAHSPLPGAPGVPGTAVLGFIACAAMVRRRAFLQAGGFDTIVRFPGEEERLAWDLADHGWQLRYLDDAVVHHHPSPHRDAPQHRRRGLARSAVLTGVMRLPPRHALARTWRTWTAGAVQRAGVLDAAPDLPAALRTRRRISALVLAQAEMLRRVGRQPPIPPSAVLVEGRRR